MESGAFIYIVENEYKSVVADAKDANGIPDWYGGSEPLSKDNIVAKFKNWLIMALRTVDVRSGDVPIFPEDAIVRAAGMSSETPPFKPMHPNVLEAISLFSTDELDSIFGASRRRELEKALIKHHLYLGESTHLKDQIKQETDLFDGNS